MHLQALRLSVSFPVILRFLSEGKEIIKAPISSFMNVSTKQHKYFMITKIKY